MAMGGDPSATDRGPPRLPHAELRRARRDRARAAREAEAALLAKTLAKLAACEQQLADSKAELAAKFVAEAAVAPPTEEGSLFEQELVGRLALAAPILKANLAEARGDGDPVARPTVLAVARRNAAMHACAWDVATIREAKLPQLNRIQRGRPKPVKDSTPQQKGHTVEQPKHAALPQAKPHWHLPARLPLAHVRVGIRPRVRRRAGAPRRSLHRFQPVHRAPAEAVHTTWTTLTAKNRRGTSRALQPKLLSGPSFFHEEAFDHDTHSVLIEKAQDHTENKNDANKNETHEATPSPDVQQTGPDKLHDDEYIIQEATDRASQERACHSARCAPAVRMLEGILEKRQLTCPGCDEPLKPDSGPDLAADNVTCVRCQRSVRDLGALAVCRSCFVAVCARCACTCDQ